MKLNCIIYTTSKNHWFKKDLMMVRSWLLHTKGREDVYFTVKTIKIPKNVRTVIDADGDKRFDWDWFEEQFVKGIDPKFNAVGFHFPTALQKKWNLSRKIRGTYHRNDDNVLDFWMCANRGEKTQNYKFSNFARILVHEILHGDVHWTSSDRELVHRWDYINHAIHELPYEISYEKWNLFAQLYEKLKGMLSTNIGAFFGKESK